MAYTTTTKPASSFSKDAKPSSTWIRGKDKGYLLNQTGGGYLLIESAGGKIVVDSGTDISTSYTVVPKP